MSMIEIKEYQSITEVPKQWEDVIGDNLYLTIEFLTFLEKNDKCEQRYFMLYDDGKLDSVFMLYTRPKYNMAMFTKFNIVRKMTMVYLPLSVTRPGIAHGKHIDEIFKFIKTIKGPKMILNLGDFNPEGYAKGLTCPKCILTNDFADFNDYFSR